MSVTKKLIVPVLGAFGLTVVALFIGAFSLVGCFSSILANPQMQKIKYPVSKPSILVIDVKGVILDQEKFIDDINHYVQSKMIKGVLVRIDSPGGSVAASHEMYTEIVRLRGKYKKPIYVFIRNLAASGGFYVAMAGDKIISNRAAILGSVGVISQFSNYEKLYEWAKVKKFNLKTGEFKDTGTPTRPMTLRERKYLRKLLKVNLSLFKEVILESRKNKVSSKIVKVISSDARIFMADYAKKHGLIDEIGSYYEALAMVGEVAGLGDTPKVFTPMEDPLKIWSSLLKGGVSVLLKWIMDWSVQSSYFNSHFKGQPFYLMPEEF